MTEKNLITIQQIKALYAGQVEYMEAGGYRAEASVVRELVAKINLELGSPPSTEDEWGLVSDALDDRMRVRQTGRSPLVHSTTYATTQAGPTWTTLDVDGGTTETLTATVVEGMFHLTTVVEGTDLSGERTSATMRMSHEQFLGMLSILNTLHIRGDLPSV